MVHGPKELGTSLFLGWTLPSSVLAQSCLRRQCLAIHRLKREGASLRVEHSSWNTWRDRERGLCADGGSCGARSSTLLPSDSSPALDTRAQRSRLAFLGRLHSLNNHL